MKTKNLKYLLVFATIGLSSCEKMVDNINDNPNQLTITAVDPGLFMNGAELANVVLQCGEFNRVAGFYSGQLEGINQDEKTKYEYNVTTITFDWEAYQGVIAPVREIRSRTTDNPLYQGMTKVLEANTIGTYASLYGDIPYSEAVSDVENPKFDDQLEIFAALQTLLSDAINDLGNAGSSVVAQDYIFAGNSTKWLQTAYTLKARYYMLTKQYDLAYAAAQNGISSKDNSMMFKPKNSGVNATTNKYYLTLTNSYNVGTANFLTRLLDNTSGVSRNNAKTNEAARLKYYTINYNSFTANTGIAAAYEPQPIVSYQENLLTLAEAGARTQGFTTGLGHLNTYRASLATGALFNSSVSALAKKYDAYVEADFNAGGMENADNIVPLRALLREIIEERYVSGFTTYMPYDDTRRLQKSDSDIDVPFPLNIGSATQNVERFLYPADEVESNSSAPSEPGLYAKTKVNL
ncbi:MAG: hypothetical protein CVU00_09875 [Bacteroidetes bacterium HGW-Bacteroidetes-17]|nr:MAG: hypothetical protein CVU00_09875 [Bacteroidetes bacterium HGW-Bacteroidetes-17]